MSGTPLLIAEHPLVVLPTLAAEIGINEAIVLQQVHYWSLRKEPDDDGEVWVYNTLEEWQEQLPWLSEATLRRAIKKLRDGGQLEVRQLGTNRTNHYRVNHDKVPLSQAIKVSASSDQSERLSNTPETSTEKTPISPSKKKVNKKVVSDEELALAADVVVAFNNIAGTALRVDPHLTPIVGRIRERPDLTAAHHRKIIEAVFAGEHWWTGPPGPRIIYGSAGRFDESLELARAAEKKKRSVVDVNDQMRQARREQGLDD